MKRARGASARLGFMHTRTNPILAWVRSLPMSREQVLDWIARVDSVLAPALGEWYRAQPHAERLAITLMLECAGASALSPAEFASLLDDAPRAAQEALSWLRELGNPCA